MHGSTWILAQLTLLSPIGRKNFYHTKNPIPSYFKIDGNELYVSHEGQKFTCKYCSEIGHKQIDCDKRVHNFPSLEWDENIVQNSNPDQPQIDALSSKKRKKNTEIRKTNQLRAGYKTNLASTWCPVEKTL